MIGHLFYFLLQILMIPRSKHKRTRTAADGIELVQKFDNKTGNWTEVAGMLIPRSGSAACALNGFIYASTENNNGKMYVLGGEEGWDR